MQIQDVIDAIRNHCGTEYPAGCPIELPTSRDQVLFGRTDRECTGVVTSIYASPHVIAEARRLGANLVIAHEALFWNRGDRIGWLSDDPVFRAKARLLDEAGVTVWRCHDCLHAGIPVGPDGKLEDAIFWGVAKKLGWLSCHVGEGFFPGVFDIPDTTLGELVGRLVRELGLKGARYVGDPETPVSRVRLMGHAYGIGEDDPLIESNRRLGIDCELALEVVDYTIAEYVRDAAALGIPKGLVTVGHFDLEEPGMELMASWLPDVLLAHARRLGTCDVPASVTYVQAGGFSTYVEG